MLALLLVACAQEDLPRAPPAPGDGLVGQAIGGVALAGQLPAWAAQIRHTDISPAVVRHNDTITVTVERPAGENRQFLAYTKMYAFNQAIRRWEEGNAIAAQSGRILGGQWAENKAVFSFRATAERFTVGQNYIVTYWCIDTGSRDNQGKRIWDCNSNKWGLGAFEVQPGGFGQYLIEQNIENNVYQSSASAQTANGVAYTAKYQSIAGVRTDVEVLVLQNVLAFKQQLAQSINAFAPTWQQRGQVCGFLANATNKRIFSWYSNGKWVTVDTFSNVPDDAKIGAYGIKHPSDCNLLNELQQLAGLQPNQCGNNVREGAEQCDLSDDTACPGLCRPDCSCMNNGTVNTGTCGDLRVQRPNSLGFMEQCEPPLKKDPITGVPISGSLCYIRDILGRVVGPGYCGEQCTCEPGVIVLPQCGNGKCDGNENHASCPADCLPGQGAQCADSDGTDYYTKGSITIGAQVTQDSCVDGNTLREQTCAGAQEVSCRCVDGKCEPQSPPYCPDAISVWTHMDENNEIWYSAYWDYIQSWSARTGAKKTGEAASLALLQGEDVDPDIDSWSAGACGRARAVWSNRVGEASTIYSSVWDVATGWSTPEVVAMEGWDPAVAVNDVGDAVAVWIRPNGVWGAFYQNGWKAPEQIQMVEGASLPQITYSEPLDKYVAVWIAEGGAMFAEFDGAWSSPEKIDTGLGGGNVLPTDRLGIDSSKIAAGLDGGQGKVVAAWNHGSIFWSEYPFTSTTNIDGIINPDVAFDMSNRWHIIAQRNDDLMYSDEGATPQAGPGTNVYDGRPAHVYLNTNIDVAVWNNNDTDAFSEDIYWSKRDTAWSSPQRVVKLGLLSTDRNPAIARLYGERIQVANPEFENVSKSRLCPDNIIQFPEQCDPPGNTFQCPNNATCSAFCTCPIPQEEIPPPICGDGIVAGNEQCDPPGSQCPGGGLCSNTCTCPSSDVPPTTEVTLTDCHGNIVDATGFFMEVACEQSGPGVTSAECGGQQQQPPAGGAIRFTEVPAGEQKAVTLDAIFLTMVAGIVGIIIILTVYISRRDMI